MALRNPWAAPDGLDDLFAAHYPQLLKWAQQLVGHDRAAGEDLVHDTFVRLALREPDLRTVQNLEGYLFVTMRNVHLSQVRRRGARTMDTSLADYDSVAASLLAAGRHQDRHAAYEELFLVARYACLRKSSSKAASALILRFFHGYYPGEIARVLRATEQAVDARLRMARAEARAFVAAPDRIRAISDRQAPAPPVDWPRDDVDFVIALRRSVFDARTGECLTAQEFDRLYGETPADLLDTETFAHIVCCAACLDTVNQRFGFRPLKDRDPSDMLGRGGRNGPPSNGAASGSDPKTSLRTRLRDVLDDRPKELRIAVNGLFVGSQAVGGEISEQRLKILIPERVGFIEVFSEFGTCLLYLDVEAPPDGPAVHGHTVSLSGGRRLTARLEFHDAAPVLDVVYEDVRAAAISPTTPVLLAQPAAPISIWARWWAPVFRLRTLGFAGGALVLIGALWTWAMWSSPTVSAAEVLRTATVAEARDLPAAGTTTHRMLVLEDRRLPDAAVIRRQRIEVWQDGSRKLQARRLFDERSHIVAGIWSRSDGTRTVYHAADRPVVESTGAAPALTASNVWTHEPSAEEFAALIRPSMEPRVNVGVADYVLTYRPDPAPESGLLEATLTVAKSDHRATGVTFTIRDAGETHAFTLTETLIEHLPDATVLPQAFEPEPELLGVPTAPPTSSRLLVPAPAVVLPAPPSPMFNVLDQLELDATYRLHRSGLWIGQHADVRRTNGVIEVRATVATEPGKAALDQSFAELETNPAVHVDITVVAEPPAAPVTEPAATSLPAYETLQAFFGAIGPGAARDEAIRAFASRVTERLDAREERIRALNTLIGEWPEDRLRQVRIESVVTWQVMVQEHADAIRRDTELLRAELAPVFKVAAVIGDRRSRTVPPMSTVAAATDAARDISAAAAAQNAVLRAHFTPCAGAACGAPFDVDQLMQSFTALESAARRFSQFFLKLDRPSDPGR